MFLQVFLFKHLTPTSLFLKNFPIFRYNDSTYFWSFFEYFTRDFPWHHTESRGISIRHHTRFSFDIARNYFSRGFTSMRIDKVMMISPLSPRWSTTREKLIIEEHGSDHFIRSKWTLESDIPSTIAIHITTEIDKVLSRTKF